MHAVLASGKGLGFQHRAEPGCKRRFEIGCAFSHIELHGAEALENSRYRQFRSLIGCEGDILPGGEHSTFQQIGDIGIGIVDFCELDFSEVQEKVQALETMVISNADFEDLFGDQREAIIKHFENIDKQPDKLLVSYKIIYYKEIMNKISEKTVGGGEGGFLPLCIFIQ